MQTLIYLCALAVLTSLCRANSLQFDIQVSHLDDENHKITEEHEVFLEEKFLPSNPPMIDIDETEEDELVGRNTINLSDEHFEEAFGKKDAPVPEHMNFALGFGAGVANSAEWSQWTCCRQVVNIQSRERVVQAPRIEMEYRKCSKDYCPASACKDDINVCADFVRSMAGVCSPGHMMSTFMSQHCPATCKFCGSSSGNVQPTAAPKWPFNIRTTKAPFRPTTRSPWRPRPTTRNPWRPRPTTRNPWTPRPPTTRSPWNPFTTRNPWNRPTTTQRPWFTTKKPWRPQTTRNPWRPQTTPNPWRPFTPKPSSNPNLVEVTVLSHPYDKPLVSYMYSISKPLVIPSLWRKIRKSSNDVSSFYLYKKSTGVYTMPIHFCRSRAKNSFASYKWAMSKRSCTRGWTEMFKLYASYIRSPSSQIMYVANSGRPHWKTRVSTTFPTNGYVSSVFFFYAPKGDSSKPQTTRSPFATNPPFRPQTTRRPFQTNPPFRPQTTRRPFQTNPPVRPQTTPRPSFTTRRPSPAVGGGEMSPYNRECLDAHNFFRAVHNVPALQWSAKLAKTAQLWASRLKEIAPRRPDELKIPSARTRNWPHSDGGGRYRNAGDGENIAWDLSGDGSPAKESVLRWYSEIFYYNRQHPTSGTPQKPVGHLTQMLWKDTTHIGCADAVADYSTSSYPLYSTWSVAHYSPGGNIRYQNPQTTLQLYNEQVPDISRQSCITKKGFCNNGNQCMAFGPSQSSCQCTSGRPICQSATGCIAWCENKNRRRSWKSECQGRSKCQCTAEKGAVCV